jgi:RNA polymerase sigma factor (sigma-70 family)
MVNVFVDLKYRPTFDRFNCESKLFSHKIHHCVSSQTCTPLRFCLTGSQQNFLLMQVVSMLHDQELIARYMDGDEQAFEILLSRYKAKIYTSIYLFVKDRALAEDIFQEVFIKIIDTLRRGKYNHEGKFVQWAMRIAYNMCVDYHRRNKRRAHINPSEDFDIFDVLRTDNDGADTHIIRSETHNHIRRMVDSLPPEQREVVILRHYADMSFKEIALLTRVSINTALGRMRYALINIRKMMNEREAVLQ